MDFTNKVNSVWINIETCKIERAFTSSKKGITVINPGVVNPSGRVRGGIEIDNQGRATFASTKNSRISIKNCEIKTDSKGRLTLNNAKTVYQLR